MLFLIVLLSNYAAWGTCNEKIENRFEGFDNFYTDDGDSLCMRKPKEMYNSRIKH